MGFPIIVTAFERQGRECLAVFHNRSPPDGAKNPENRILCSCIGN